VVLRWVVDGWVSDPPVDFPNYSAGSSGPDAADRVIPRDGRRWGVPRDL